MGRVQGETGETSQRLRDFHSTFLTEKMLPGPAVHVAPADGETEAAAQPQARQNKQNRPRSTTDSGKEKKKNLF